MFKRTLRYSFKKGSPKQKLVTPLFILKFQESSEPKYAVVSGKVVSKKAVERNRAKRVFVSALKEIVEKNPISYDLVFFLRRPYEEFQKSAIISELENLISQLNAKR